MTLFPFANPEEIDGELIQDLPIAREWAWDFENNDFKRLNNKPYLVDKVEAVKIWAYKALLTKRFQYSVYSWDYGNEIKDLVGSGFSRAATESEVQRMIHECVMPNSYIEGVKDFEIESDGDKLNVTFTLITVYGEVEVSDIGY